ncbi:DUF2156 domain-containing protein [Clostridium grantii]|uniref:Phosphatidylglycerol lysyltransferase n=1 Tax=Clostridium grantii DSM 8605 TaxID=1121316 RepID=A0A1M5XM64_9CLOT|nr:DUF2156 domain-containing protein [Clostridium grantii]SHI00945.1 phosphatidylglycerol lysyltransferase [Clostridium grantii DSM 8605]
MKKEKFGIIKILVQNLAILMIVFSGIANIVLSMPYRFDELSFFGNYYSKINTETMAIHGALKSIIGFILLTLSYRLYKRMKSAWIITLVTIGISATLHIVNSYTIFNFFTMFEIFIILVLGFSYKDFTRSSDPLSTKNAIMLALLSIVFVVINTAIRLFQLRANYNGVVYFWDSIVNSIKLLFLMDTSVIKATTNLGKIYVDASIGLNWVFIISALLLVLKPIVYNPIISSKDRKKVLELVNNYGQNPMSYLAIEKDKKYFFGNLSEGVIAYGLVKDVMVCCGDMICAEEEAPLFIKEFMSFCKRNKYSVIFINVTDKFLSLYNDLGFQSVKYGEDATFKLSEYNLAGGKIAKVRAAINHANKAGILVSEYKPLEHKDMKIENEINEVSNEWLKSKKSGELSFMLGGVGLEEPLGRRYFFAKDANDKILGFVVFVPYDANKGYLADITRRRNDAPQGVLEKIIYDAFMIMKEEGVVWGNMGLVPLANLREENEKVKTVTLLFEFIYENLNNFYGFKPLYKAKEKYAPTHWVPRYLVYNPKLITPQMAYAIVKIQNPKGIKDYILPIMNQKSFIKRKTTE